MADIVVSVQAYCKLLLHAAKYPHCSVNGVLLTEKSKNKETNDVVFVDCIPLFHSSLGLTPMLEVALSQVDSYCKSHGLVVGGYYQANEYFRDSNPNAIAYKIADRICDNFSDACILMVNNLKMKAECSEPVYRLYQATDGKWKEKGHAKETLEKGALPAASAMLHSKAYRTLVDFDNHLDDIALDWRNLALTHDLEHLS